MKKLNTVIDGDFIGSNVISAFGNIYIQTSILKKEDINIDNVENLEYLKDHINEKNEPSSEINIKFKSGKMCTIWVDNDILEKISKIWPEDKLFNLLQKGYKIVGFSSCILATSGLGAGSMAHNILLQKDLSVSKITIITNGTKEIGRNFHIFSSENKK